MEYALAIAVYVGLALWTGNIAFRKNRIAPRWFFFSLLFPILALIWVAFTASQEPEPTLMELVAQKEMEQNGSTQRD